MQNKNPKKKLGIYTLNIGVIRKSVKMGGQESPKFPFLEKVQFTIVKGY